MHEFRSALGGRSRNVMLSPGFMVVLVQPLWRRKLGLLISIAHSSTTPMSFFTLTYMNVWGLVHSTLVTTPVNVIG